MEGLVALVEEKAHARAVRVGIWGLFGQGEPALCGCRGSPSALARPWRRAAPPSGNPGAL